MATEDNLSKNALISIGASMINDAYRVMNVEEKSMALMMSYSLY